MKELSIEDKAKAYDKALDAIKNLREVNPSDEGIQNWVNDNFPELKESEEDKNKRIKRIVHGWIDSQPSSFFNLNDISKKEMLAWLEKQGEPNPYSGVSFEYNGHTWGMCARDNGVDILLDKQLFKHLETQGEQDFMSNIKTAEESLGIDSETYNKIVDECVKEEMASNDKVEPKFKVGDWITNDVNVVKVQNIKEDFYICENTTGSEWDVSNKDAETNYHLWTIDDAKAGDVLAASDGSIFIFAGVDGSACKHYVAFVPDDVLKFNEGLEHYWETSRTVHPATKEERDTLMKAMADAGYTFDFEKKELKKIEQKPAWSEEDNERIEQICEDLRCGLINFRAGRTVKGMHFDEIIESNINWLKLLKDKYTTSVHLEAE